MHEQHVIATISLWADHVIEQGYRPNASDDDVEKTIIDHVAKLEKDGTDLPEETRLILLGLLLNFELKRRERQAGQNAVRQMHKGRRPNGSNR